MEKVENKQYKSLLAMSLKGSLIAVCVSLIAILIFAFVVKLTGMSGTVIKVINQIIKVISIFIGSYFTLKNVSNKGFLTGMLVGVLYTLTAFVVFSILNGNFNFNITIIIDLIFGAIMGLICGSICINLKK